MLSYTDQDGNTLPIEFLNFPAGETHLKNYNVSDVTTHIDIKLDFENNGDMINLLHFDQLAQINGLRYNLICPYFPAGRQDRIENKSESFSLLSYVAVIKALGNMDKLEIADPHSDVLPAVLPLNTEILYQHDILYDLLSKTLISKHDSIVLVAPDKGASKKILKNATFLNQMGYNVIDILQADKIRDYESGQIVKTSVEQKEITSHTHLIVVDDICDGGRTFVELGKVLNQQYPDNSLKLFVSHGIFSKGLSELQQYYDQINAYWKHPTYNKQ